MEIIKTLQGVELDGHRLELKISNRKGTETVGTARKEAKNQVQPENSSKLIVRNVPFQCTAEEIRSLFTTFGQVKSCRTPKKHSGQHRGFCFVEMGTSSEGMCYIYKSSVVGSNSVANSKSFVNDFFPLLTLSQFIN